MLTFSARTLKYMKWVGLGLVLISALIYPAAAQTPTPNPATILQDCANSLPPDRPIPTGANAPSIRIISPTSGTFIKSSMDRFVEVPFTIEVTNFELPGTESGDTGNHWHFWLNDGVWGMYGRETISAYLPYGTWRICASVGDTNHLDIGMPDAIIITIADTDDPTIATIPDSPNPPAATIPDSSPDSPLPQLLVIALAIIALAGGLWLGSRSNRPK